MNNQSMSVDAMYRKLLSDGVVECNSPKNRFKLYQKLKAANLKFDREVIGNTGTTRSMWRKRMTPLHFTKWLESGRVTEEILRKAQTGWPHGYRLTEDDFQQLFDRKVSWNAKIEILEPFFEERNMGWRTTIDCCYYQKTIVRITLREQH